MSKYSSFILIASFFIIVLYEEGVKSIVVRKKAMRIKEEAEREVKSMKEKARKEVKSMKEKARREIKSMKEGAMRIKKIPHPATQTSPTPKSYRMELKPSPERHTPRQAVSTPLHDNQVAVQMLIVHTELLDEKGQKIGIRYNGPLLMNLTRWMCETKYTPFVRDLIEEYKRNKSIQLSCDDLSDANISYLAREYFSIDRVNSEWIGIGGGVDIDKIIPSYLTYLSYLLYVEVIAYYHKNNGPDVGYYIHYLHMTGPIDEYHEYQSALSRKSDDNTGLCWRTTPDRRNTIDMFHPECKDGMIDYINVRVSCRGLVSLIKSKFPPE